MSNPFADLQTALANATGMDSTLAGIVLWMIVTVGMFIIVVWVLDPKAQGNDAMTIIVAGGIGTALSYAVGWISLWVPIFIGFFLLFVAIDPLGMRKGNSSG